MSRIGRIHDDYLDPDKHLWPPEEPEGPSDDDLLDRLDAYGHLTWTMGDLDWMACFDAIREGDRIAYHAVVNCESGGWINTIEKGVLTVEEAARLLDLPSQYFDSGFEGHMMSRESNTKKPRDQRMPLGHFAWRSCARRWRRHIEKLIKG